MSSVLTFICHWIFKTVLLCCWLVPVYPGCSPSIVEKDCCPKVSQVHGSLRAVYYCRMHGSLCVIRQKAAHFQDLEEGWSAGSERRGLTKTGFFGKFSKFSSPDAGAAMFPKEHPW